MLHEMHVHVHAAQIAPQPTQVLGLDTWTRDTFLVCMHGGVRGPLVPRARTCRQVRFAPRQLGLVLGVLADDGCMYVFEADRVLASSHWQLHSKFQVRVARTRRWWCLH